MTRLIDELQAAMDRLRMRRLSRRLTHFQLQRADGDDDESLLDEDLIAQLEDPTYEPRRFLDYYSERGITEALQLYGVLGTLQERGFEPVIEIGPSGGGMDRLFVSDAKTGEHLVEVVAALATMRPQLELGSGDPQPSLQLLAVNWLLLQDPIRPFEEGRPRLPGQRHRGLGLLREASTILEIAAERLRQDGILVFPEHYHHGCWYGRRFRHLSPQAEGEFRALERDLQELSLAQASWAVAAGLVFRHGESEPYRWHPTEMVLPVDCPALATHLTSRGYREVVRSSREATHFHYDREAVMARVAVVSGSGG